MEIEQDSLDDVLIELYTALLSHGVRNEGQRGSTVELLSTSLRIRQPRTRLSRSENRGRPFSAIGELLWYLSGSDKLDFIKPYIPRYKSEAVDGVLLGAYGPRFFNCRGAINQFENVLNLLARRPGSRRAVIQLFDACDLTEDFKEIPCTTTLQLHLREDKLHMTVSMRSNDAYWGLPHDVFCFTMLQEMLARKLEAELGEYYHHAGSMHVYDDCLEGLQQYTREGHHRPVEMPPMPSGDPFQLVPTLLDVESKIRLGEDVSAEMSAMDTYWADFIRLIQVFWAKENEDHLASLKRNFSHRAYGEYLEDLRERVRKREVARQSKNEGSAE